MSPLSHFLLVGGSPDDCGHKVLRGALAGFASLQVASEDEMASLIRRQTYDVVIVDAGAVASAPEVVSQILGMAPDTKVVVVTASPHWKIAKAVFQAGATDYFYKSLSNEEIVASFQAVLKKHAVIGTASAEWEVQDGESNDPLRGQRSRLPGGSIRVS